MALFSKMTARKPVSDAQRVTSAARWFYWIAGLTVVNCALAVAGSTVSLLLGLTTPLIAVYIALGVGRIEFTVMGMALAIIIAAGFVFLGWIAEKGRSWAFIAGASLYAADTIWSVVYRDWMSVVWHALALGAILSGLFVLRRMKAATPRPGAVSAGAVAGIPPVPLSDAPQGFADATAPAPLD